MTEDERRKTIEALAQRGLSEREILLSAKLDHLTVSDLEAIGRGRASGVALVNSELFKQAIKGNIRAIEIIGERLQANTKPDATYSDRLLAMIEQTMW